MQLGIVIHLSLTIGFRENQETYTDAGGFEANDDEHEERRARINEARQRSESLLYGFFS